MVHNLMSKVMVI